MNLIILEIWEGNGPSSPKPKIIQYKIFRATVLKLYKYDCLILLAMNWHKGHSSILGCGHKRRYRAFFDITVDTFFKWEGNLSLKQ